MERTLIINEVLNHDITKFTNTLIPPDFNGDVHKLRMLQEFLKQIISNLGAQSAAAQGLSKVITTGEKLQQSMNHYLYLLKDPKAKDNHGDVVGFLKVGYKRLYLFDSKNMVCEVEPLCVLDFYVQDKYRRQGHGRRLFDYMIEDMNVNPHELAIDGPSQNMISFLSKNYNMEQLVRHNNNFAVSPLFFETLPQNASSSRDATPSRSARVGRFTAIRPPSSIASIIHGGDQPSDLHSNKNGNDGSESDAEPLPDREPAPAAAPEPQPSPERPSTLHIEPIDEPAVTPPISPAGSTTPRRDSQLTDRGYFDVKFYHNKLW